MKALLAALSITLLPIALCGLVEAHAVTAWQWLYTLGAELLYAIFDTAIKITLILN